MPLTTPRTPATHVAGTRMIPLQPDSAQNFSRLAPAMTPPTRIAPQRTCPACLPKRGASGMHEGAGEPGDEAANGHGGEAAHDGRAKLGFSLVRQPVHPSQCERYGRL